MDSYDKQYKTEVYLFGLPYPEFEAFVAKHVVKGGTALDLGCGQGRDALMLADYGYVVTGVDSSHVGVSQMVERANARGGVVHGVVDDLYAYPLTESFDLIVLDSILHFGKADKKKELALLNAVADRIKANGYLCLFVHKSDAKEKVLHEWFTEKKSQFAIAEEGYIDYVYEVKSTDFKSAFQYYMLILQRSARA